MSLESEGRLSYNRTLHTSGAGFHWKIKDAPALIMFLYMSWNWISLENEGCLSYSYSFYVHVGIGLHWEMVDVSAIVIILTYIWG